MGLAEARVPAADQHHHQRQSECESQVEQAEVACLEAEPGGARVDGGHLDQVADASAITGVSEISISALDILSSGNGISSEDESFISSNMRL